MPSSAAVIFDPSILPVNLGTDDPETLASFYEMFIELTQAVWAEVQSSQTGVAPEALRSTAHKLKSSSASIGALRLTEELRRLEQLAVRQDALQITTQIALVSSLVEESVLAVRAYITELGQG
jgi:HPt (histidine-containing phosphotransfer) domain-containing protein